MILMILMDAQFWQPLAQPNPTWSPTESILAPTSDHVKWLVICEHGTGKINQEPRHTQSSPGCWWSQRGDWGLLVIRCSKHTCRPSELTKGSLRAPTALSEEQGSEGGGSREPHACTSWSLWAIPPKSRLQHTRYEPGLSTSLCLWDSFVLFLYFLYILLHLCIWKLIYIYDLTWKPH